MATDFYPDRPIPFDRFLAVVRAEPRLYVVRADGGAEVVIEYPRGECFHARALGDDSTVVTRYGHNDPEPALRVLDELFGVRFGPEHERDPGQ